jgi:DNA repair photolyase
MATLIAEEKIIKPLQESNLNKKSLCDYVINVASGCLHGCTFCYVPSTPVIRTRQQHFANKGVSDPQMDWGQYLMLREELPERLEVQLQKKRSWKSTLAGRGVTLLCSGTDPYQNQRTARLTREAIKILKKYDRPIRILTRSPLWLQDLDLLVDRNITVGMSLPHLDDALSRVIEPYAPLPSDRLKALRKGAEAGCRIFVAVAPTPPTMRKSDFIKHLERILPLNPEVIFWEPINARGSNGKRMMRANIPFASSIIQSQGWVENFLRQWVDIDEAAKSLGCEQKIHIWPDPGLEKFVDIQELEAWWYRPTVEIW